MTVIATEVDLKNFIIYFGPENGEKIYYEQDLCRYDNIEIAKALDYHITTSTKAGNYVKKFKEGKVKASRFRKLCINLGKNPEEIHSKYSSKVFRYTQGGRGCLEKIDKETEEAVWSAICDGYDNKS